MTDCKLTYFDMDGGRGEPIRIALHAAGVDFEDHRVAFPDFQELRQKLPFGCVPVFEVDGVAVTQSNAIARYVGKMGDLYPEDELQALYCDEAMDAVEDISHYLGPTFGLQGEALKTAREQLVERRLSVFLPGLAKLLGRGGGRYFADKRLTVADLKVFVQTRWFRSGKLDHIPDDLVDSLAPALAEHQTRIERDPVVVAYYAARGK
ncbi:MAG: glutathione S-transferase family protein [Woeseiaceae bacterium]